MTIHDAQVNRVTQRAYEFAMSGAFESMAALERQLVLEGFGHNLWWLERPGVRRTLAEISVTSRRLQASAERPSICLDHMGRRRPSSEHAGRHRYLIAIAK